MFDPGRRGQRPCVEIPANLEGPQVATINPGGLPPTTAHLVARVKRWRVKTPELGNLLGHSVVTSVPCFGE